MQPSSSTLALAALAVTVAAAAPVAGTAAAADESPAFENGTVAVVSGETAEVPVSVPETNGSARVTVGSEATNFVAHATVVDADGDGTVTLAFDTGAAGTTDAAPYLRVSDGDELRDATQETDRRASPLAPAEYDLRLGPAGDPVDVGTLVVESASTSEPTTPEATDDDAATTDGATTTGAPVTPPPEPTTTPGDTQTSSPGFGALAAVTALLAVAGLAARG
jgi:PGF-CTERM protein